MNANRRIMALAVLVGMVLVQDALAFYNPQTGRWLSRDPIGERGGLNQYVTSRNDAVGRIDKLGLISPDLPNWPPAVRCGKCGPDVTEAVMRTLQQVEKEFLDDMNPNYGELPPGHQGPLLPPDEYRYEACKALYTPGSGGTAWEVLPLVQIGNRQKPTGMPGSLSDADLGSGHCAGTVTFQGRCVWAGGLNYILFGKANKLCSSKFADRPYTFETGSKWMPEWTTTWSQMDMLAAVGYWKFGHYGRKSEKGCAFNPELWSAFNFANEGYTGDQYSGGQVCGCRTDGAKQWSHGSMKWRWRGVHSGG